MCELSDRCAAVLLALPRGACVSHVTGAQLRSWWLPDCLVPGEPLIVSTPDETAHLDRRGVYARRLLLPETQRTQYAGVAVASPAQVIRELAEDFSLIDLVVALDAALHLGHLDTADLPSLPVRGRRGVRVLRQAIALCDGRSESAWETILRLVHVLSGITCVEPQKVIVDATGVPVARADLWLRGTNRLAEYDGADHRDRDQHQRDLRREKVLSRLGHERFGYTKPEIVGGAREIIRDAECALDVEHDPLRVEGWLAEFRMSSLSSTGRARLRRRLARFRRPAPPRSRPRVAQE